MSDSNNSVAIGKKIFFLHPSAITINDVIAELAQEEFEVYYIKDDLKLKKALSIYPSSILFASINEAMKESAWEELIRSIIEKSETTGVLIGIIASMNNDFLKNKYLEKYKIRCGFTVIKSDMDAAARQLRDILNEVNAKGRRKYIRLIMEKETDATLNLPIHGTYVKGYIKDISVVGFSCSFSDEVGLKKNGLFSDIQLKLHSQLLRVEGVVFGSRMDGADQVYVILFTQRVDPSVHTKIRKYIQSSLQHRMDEELK